MFAFALWDARTHTLFLTRDRVGKKPLYYYKGHDRFVFGSEIKALLADPAVPREPDPVALDHYLALQYIPAPLTAFRGIRKLPAAHWLELHDGHLETGRYWRLHYTPKRTISMHDAMAELQWHLAEAVRLRLVSDVPLGVFLSGGIDSSAVVASMREVTGQRISTFTVGFGASAASYDELPYARMVARRFETEHHEEILEPVVADLLPTIVHHFDEPFADSSAIPTFVVAQATSRHVKVVLSGIGGDETFAGYPRYLGLRLSQLYTALPRPLRMLPAAAARRLVRESEASPSWGSRLRRFLDASDQPLPDRYLGLTRFFSDAD